MLAEPTTKMPISLEDHFKPFRKNIIGQDLEFQTPYGPKKLLYADWIASGRMYAPIEEIFQNDIFPLVGNTHTKTTVTGCSMTYAYHKAKEIIKNHVNADPSDILISSNSGMTGVINKLQRILGLKVHESFRDKICLEGQEKPIVFITHMEHHSNQTSWLETLSDVCIIEPTDEGLVDLDHFTELLENYKDRKVKIAAITSCSNVTGVFTPYHEMAEMIHNYDGWCFVDFACSAPYININMHPENEKQYLDAIYFSPHKFLGGPSGTGILIFNQSLYQNTIPDNPGGGTVEWTNPWGEHKYFEEIEEREDGGTPAFLQTMRVALSTQLKDQMGVDNIHNREHELIERIWPTLEKVANLHVLADNIKHRLGVISFYIDGLHYNLGVKMLNDRYGIQVRGGCSCAGTYGHYLLAVSHEKSKSITNAIGLGDYTSKPGWIRLSLHPTLTDKELDYIADALKSLAENFENWSQSYQYDTCKNEFLHHDDQLDELKQVDHWFSKLS